MLSALFDGGANPDVNLSDLQNHFYTSLPPIRDAMFDALVDDGYYLHRPDTVRQGYIGVGFVLGSAAIRRRRLSRCSHGHVAVHVDCFGHSYRHYHLRHSDGSCPREQSPACARSKKFWASKIFSAARKRIRLTACEKTPELFEKYLPYAMALRVEKKWAQAFSGIAMQPPSWYQGYYGAGFQPYFLVNNLNMMSMQTGSVMASSPRSSSGGSGFGGGGGSGGGFGGGGGGGF